MTVCPYGGEVIVGDGPTCPRHADLPALDPDWEDFMARSEPTDCIHCGEYVRKDQRGRPVECPKCWWLVRFSREEILEFAAGLDTLATSVPAPRS